MPSYTLDQRAVHDKQLAANTADTVSIETEAHDEAISIEILSDGAAEIYVSTDGSTALLSGPKCFKIPKGSTTSFVFQLTTDQIGVAVLSLISSGTPIYSVTLV